MPDNEQHEITEVVLGEKCPGETGEHCGAALHACPESEASARALVYCRNKDCDWLDKRHWRELLPYQVTDLNWARAKRRHARAEAAGDEAAAERIADRMLDVAEKEEVLEAFRGS